MSTTDDSDPRFWQNTSRYDVNSKIYLITIIIFSSIIFFVFLYYLYVRFILRRREPSSSLAAAAFAVSQPPKRGLDPLLIASLPTFIVEVNATECSVCLQILEEKDSARMLPNCKHVFHVACVDAWLVTRSTCPVCRSEVQPRLETEPREGLVREPLDLTAETTASSSRLDSFKKMMIKEKSLNKNHSRIEHDLEKH